MVLSSLFQTCSTSELSSTSTWLWGAARFLQHSLCTQEKKKSISNQASNLWEFGWICLPSLLVTDGGRASEKSDHQSRHTKSSVLKNLMRPNTFRRVLCFWMRLSWECIKKEKGPEVIFLHLLTMSNLLSPFLLNLPPPSHPPRLLVVLLLFFSLF